MSCVEILSPVARYELRCTVTALRKEEPLSLSLRILAVVKTIFSFIRAVCSLFSENDVKTMKEYAACVWTSVQYGKLELRGLSNFDSQWVVEFEPENEALLRELLDESPYPLDTLLRGESRSLFVKFDELSAPVMLGVVQVGQGHRADPTVVIRISSQSPTGEITKAVVTLWQNFESRSELTEATLFAKKGAKSLFFKSEKNVTKVSKEADGFQALKRLLSERQVTIDNVKWSLA